METSAKLNLTANPGLCVFFPLGWHPNAWPVMPVVGLFRTRILDHFHKLSLDAGQQFGGDP
jgi:hypothetical protein